MRKTTKSGVTYSYPINKKSKIKCEGYSGAYTIIDAATYDGEVYVFLEHDFYGDETAYLLAVLPLTCLRWYVVDKMNGNQLKRLFIRSDDILAESYDSIDVALLDEYDGAELEDIEFWTDEEINNMEVM